MASMEMDNSMMDGGNDQARQAFDRAVQEAQVEEAKDMFVASAGELSMLSIKRRRNGGEERWQAKRGAAAGMTYEQKCANLSKAPPIIEVIKELTTSIAKGEATLVETHAQFYLSRLHGLHARGMCELCICCTEGQS